LSPKWLQLPTHILEAINYKNPKFPTQHLILTKSNQVSMIVMSETKFWLE